MHNNLQMLQLAKIYIGIEKKGEINIWPMACSSTTAAAHRLKTTAIETT